jgi:tetratricopeptide (TPR) repeat protein
MRTTVPVLTCLLIAFLTGCSSINGGAGSQTYHLTPEQMALADALAHYSQGVIWSSTDGSESPRAFKEFAEALRLHPDNDRLYPSLTYYCLDSDPNNQLVIEVEDKCIDFYTSLSEADPKRTLHYLTLARLYFHQSKDADALRVLANAIKNSEHPTLISAFLFSQGKAFIMKKQISRSILCFKLMAYTDTAKTSKFYHILGELYEMLGRDDEAERNFILASNADTPNPDSFIRLAYLRMKDHPDKAIKTLIDANKRHPDDPLILFHLGFIYKLQKDMDNAISVLQTIPPIVKKNKDQQLQADFYIVYGGACEESGLIEKAEKIFTDAIEIYPDSHELLNYLAYMWAENDMKLEKALTHIASALEQQPDNGAYIDTLGWIYYKQGRYDDALAQLKEAGKIIPNDPVVMEHIGDTHKVRQNIEKAIEFWKKSFLLDPEYQSVIDKLESHNISPSDLLKEVKTK